MNRPRGALEEYYTDFCQKTVVSVDSLGAALKALACPLRDDVVYTVPNRYYRKLLCTRKKYAVIRDLSEKEAKEFFLLLQLFSMLHDKGVACYRFTRPDIKDIKLYSPLARQRIKQKLSFPRMSENYTKYEEHFKEILGEKCSEAYVSNLRKIPQVIYRGRLYGHEDAQTELVNTCGGLRIVKDCPEQSERTIHVYGRCGAFGYAVEDAQSLPGHLQTIFRDSHKPIAVVNHGIWGADESLILNNMLIDSAKYTSSDVVILYERSVAQVETELLDKHGVLYYDCTDAFHSDKRSAHCFYDRPGHMSGEGYAIIAKYVAQCLENTDYSRSEKQRDAKMPSHDYISEYMANIRNSEFDSALKEYLGEIQRAYPSYGGLTTGAIVMNCNPFTLGHRYLIEYASKRVDRLYVFVLQEDKSFFPFTDRFELVKKGTLDIPNVIVLPSGEFMISTFTFPEYFMKEYKKCKDFDATKDLNVFAHVIAPALGITVRFAGEEPIDVVTREYNDNMRRILPQAGVKFCEIPRKTVDGARVVSASKVRELLKEGKWDEMKMYVPMTTYEYLVDKYRQRQSL